MKLFSFKDLEKVRLKAKRDFFIGARAIEAGETIAFFNTLEMVPMEENISIKRVSGGVGNHTQIVWQTTQEMPIEFRVGTFSTEQFSLLANAKLIEQGSPNNFYVTKREYLESDENGKFTCKYLPARNIFLYAKDTGARIEFAQAGNEITISKPFTDVIIDYEFLYISPIKTTKIGQRLLSGTMELEGITRVKDSITGVVTTGIFKIPSLLLLSDFSIRLGSEASPIVSTFKGTAIPVGSRGNTYVGEFHFLSDDIESDL